jgi:hypothetical protein
MAICQTVFGSGYFAALGEDPLSADEAYEELKTKHASIFEMLHRENSNINGNKPLNHLTDIRWVDNIASFDGKELVRSADYVWTCVTRNWRTDESQVYFISDLYNVAFDAPRSHSAAHFILRPEDDGNVLKAIALIENPAQQISSHPEFVENNYLSYRKNNELGKR